MNGYGRSVYCEEFAMKALFSEADVALYLYVFIPLNPNNTD